jgi:hypothetical protein
VSWGKFVADQIEYDLTHLDPFNITVPTVAPKPIKKDRIVRVTFGCHTFTREWEDADLEHFRFEDEGHLRCFCPSRHALSVNLPDLIRQAATGKVRFNNKRSPFLTVHNVPGSNGPYVIYFDAIKANSPGLDVVIDIRSAHSKPNYVDNGHKVGFATIIGLTAAGQKVERPKK